MNTKSRYHTPVVCFLIAVFFAVLYAVWRGTHAGTIPLAFVIVGVLYAGIAYWRRW